MLRRHFFGLPMAALTAYAQRDPSADRELPARGQKGASPDTFIAGATEDATPRVAIVLSNFKGSKDHDGTSLPGLRSPCATDSRLSAAQLEDMVRRAIELGNTRRGELASLVSEASWIVIKPQITAHRTAAGRLIAGSVADPRVVRAVAKYVAEKAAGKRITIAEAPSLSVAEFDPWTSDWDGTFGGATYRKVVDELAREYPRTRFDIADLNRDETMDMQTPARAGVAETGMLKISSTLLRSGAMITVAPLATSTATGVSLTFGSYLGALPASVYGRTKEKASGYGAAAEFLVDLFSFRPPDYAIVGGEWGLEGGDPQTPDAASVRHNVVIAGANAVAVDRVAAGVMGFDPSRIAHLDLAARRGFGVGDLDSIWMRGNEIEEARRAFRAASSR